MTAAILPLSQRIIVCEQNSAEWYAARVGRVTGSRVADATSFLKGGGESAARRDYRAQLVAEQLTGESQERDFENAEMRWGKEQEPFAIAAYEVARGVMVDRVGFVLHPDLHGGASPDALVGFDGERIQGGLEAKCPKTATHLRYIQEGVVPADYKPQMTWQAACTGAEWVDFVSFDPRMPENLQLFIRRFVPTPNELAAQHAQIARFVAELDAQVSELRKRGAA